MPKRSPGYALLFLLAPAIGYPLRLFFRAVPGSAALLPPASVGSLGDEAMASVVLANLRERGKRARMVRIAANDEWSEVFPDVESIGPVWNASLPAAARLRACCGVVAALLRSEEIWCIGADVLDGHYDSGGAMRILFLLSVLAHAGRSVTITGFSWNTHPAPSSLEGMRSLQRAARLFCRDPISHARLLASGVNARLAADLAFLLAPAENPRFGNGVDEFLAAARADGATVIGVCPHLTHATEEELEGKISAMAEAVGRMLSPERHAVAVLLAHDTRRQRGGVSQHDIVLRILDRVPAGARGRVIVFPVRDGMAGTVRALCGTFSFAVSGSMHFTISCLTRGVPTVSLTYQDKFEGLFAHMGLPSGEFALPQSELAANPLRLDDLVAPLFDADARSRHARTIAEALPGVIRLSRSHFPSA